MASPAYEQILAVQALDMSIRQLRHREASHPARAQVAQIDGRLTEHDAATSEVAERRHELERSQKRLEDEVATIESKRQDIDGKLYGGDVTASKELLALQDEANQLLERQRGLEDEQLELMEEMEGVDQEMSALAATRAAIESERTDAETELQQAIEEILAEIGSLEGERTASVGPANPELLARYESLREQYDGVAVARLNGGRCDGCHIQLSAVAVDRMGKMAEDAVVTCEECGRLLVR